MATDKKVMTPDEDEFDLKKVLSKFIDHWKIYLFSIIVCVLIGYFYMRYTTPMYNISAKLLVKEEESGSSGSFMGSAGVMSDFTGLFGSQSNMYNELGILQTRDLLKQVVMDMHLNLSYYKEETLRTEELYNNSPFIAEFFQDQDSIQTTTFNILFSESNPGRFTISNSEISFSLNAAFNDTIKTPVGRLVFKRTNQPLENVPYLFKVAPISIVIDQIANNLTIDFENTESSIISLAYNTNIPQKGEDFLNGLIQKYTTRNLNEKNRVADSAIAFINARTAIVSKELSNIESDIQQFKQSNKIADLTEQSKALIDNSGNYLDKLNETDIQLNIIKTTLSYLKSEQNNSRPVPSLLNADPTFLELVQKYNSLQVEHDRLMFSVKENNPLSNNLNIQIQNLRNDLIKSLENQIKAAEITKSKIVSENSAMSRLFFDVPVQERQYIDLSREKDVKQGLYLYLLQKKEETAITKSSNLSSATVLEVPQSAYNPYAPNKPLIFGLSICLGLLLPTGFVLIKEFLSNRITSRDVITKATDCSIMAEIGHSEKNGLLSLKDDGRTIVAEQFRIFRTNLEFAIGRKKCPKIMLTSFMSGEGKSFISINLAQMYAFSGKKVLLMEMDLRKPHISATLEIPNEKGFSNLIVSGGNVKDFIKPVSSAPNLFLLQSGPLSPNPAELLMMAEVPDLFEELSRQFDFIIIDTPPVSLVTDALILSRYSDINLFVVRENYTFKNSLEFINELRDTNKLSPLYLVINDAQKGASYKYGYGYGYGHGYYAQQNGQAKKSKLRKMFHNK